MRRDLAIGAVLMVAILAVYGQVIHHEFVILDDGAYVNQNAHVQRGLTWEGVAWAFTDVGTEVGNWHPVTWLSHMVDVQLFGLQAGYHHLVNVLLHILNSVLLYLTLRRMTKAVWRSAVVAVLFAVHPLHVESVAWVAERKDVLSTMFFMLTLLAYGWYVTGPGLARYGLVMGLLALGLMAKPMLVTVPLVLLLLDYWPLERVQSMEKATPTKGKGASRKPPGDRRSNLTGLLIEKIPLFALVIASGVVTLVAQHNGKTTFLNYLVPFGYRILNALMSYGAYLEKMLWPSALSVYYPYRLNITTVQWIGVVVIVTAMSGLVFWLGRRSRYLAVGWLWYLGTLVPVIGLMQVGEQSMADRYTYIPSIGICIAVVWGITELTMGLRYSRICRVIAAGAVSLGCMAVTRVQVGYWQNSITLFQHALDVTTDNTFAHIDLGHVLELQGTVDEAILQYEKALKIRPHQPVALAHLGSALLKQGKLDKAASVLREALEYNPENADAHSNLGFALTQQGRLEEAIAHLHEALKLNPRHAEALNNLGTALERQGRLGEAIDQFRNVLVIDPKHQAAQNNVGVVLIKQGRLDEAVGHFREVLKLNPDNAEAHNNLGIILATQGKIDEAISQFREVVRIDPAYPEAQYKLGVLLTRQAEQGSHQ